MMLKTENSKEIMTPEIKKIKEKLERKEITVDRKELDKVVKDRLDFGFDSLYFRYAEVCDELAAYKARANGSCPIAERARMDSRKMRFYQTLEQLVHAHPEREDDLF